MILSFLKISTQSERFRTAKIKNWISVYKLNFVKKEDKNRNNPDDEGSFYIPLTLIFAFLLVLFVIVSLLIIIFFNVILYFLESSVHPIKVLFP